MNQYDVVRVKKIRDDRFASQPPHFQRHPRVGDVGIILDDYGADLEVECSERDTGVTIWLEPMYREELEAI